VSLAGRTATGISGWRHALLCLACAGCTATADDGGLSFRTEVSVEVQDDYVFAADDPQAELNDAYPTIESDLAFATPDDDGLFAKLNFEPVRDPTGDRVFEDLGVYLEELYVGWGIGQVRLRIGKLDPRFGAAQDLAPGLYGDELSGDYELTERIGASVDFPFEALGGEQVLSAALFLADRTVLSDSLFTSRGPLHLSDGGVSNTRGPESIAVSLAGEVAGTGYDLGLRYQATGEGDAAAEYGAVAGVLYGFETLPLEPTLFAEAAWFPNFDGERESVGYLTIGPEIEIGETQLSATYGLRTVEGSGTDLLATASLEHELNDHLSAGIGYRWLREEGAASHTVGVLLTLDFSVDQIARSAR